MFYSLTGMLVHTEQNIAVVECGGVGFKCFATTKTLGQMTEIGQTVTLFTYLSVREDALDLYGFADMDELEMFKLLINVSGVGAKMAMALLSEFTPDKLSLLIASGDSKSITVAPGIGAKLAQRIVLELKDKVSVEGVEMPDDVVAVGNIRSQNSKDAVSALLALGYTRFEASKAVSGLSPDLSTEELIKGALKSLMKNF